MSDQVQSFVFSAEDARACFRHVGELEVVLATLARVMPLPAWEGCEVYLGQAPELEGQDPATLVCVGIEGPGAAQVRLALVQSFEAVGIAVPGVFDGGPEATTPVATVGGGRWVRAQ